MVWAVLIVGVRLAALATPRFGRVVLCVTGALFAVSLDAAEVVFGDLDIWYDETPLTVPGGSMSWKGKTTIRLMVDEATGAITGSGDLPFDYKATTPPCTATGNGTRRLTLRGRKTLTGIELDVAAGPATVSVRVACPGSPPVSLTRTVAQNETQHVELPASATKPIKPPLPPGRGVGVFYQLQQCPTALVTAALLPVTTPATWQTPTRLTTLTVPGIRTEAQNQRSLGLTRHNFTPKDELTDKTKPSGDAVCYWLEKVDLRFDPVEVLIPGLNWDENTCEFKAIDDHEQKHVNTLTGLLREFSTEFTRILQSGGLPQIDRPWRVMNAEEGRAKAHQRIADLLGPVRDRYQERRKRAADRIDTTAEYNAVHARCPGGWVQH